jgi:2-polyprenyl-3-methyl-5-hydroxy-6-metoxy-1,4-benzoquinol methylase
MDSASLTPVVEHTLEWEAIDCPLCGSSDDQLLLEASGIEGIPCRMVLCRDCGMGYLNPRPTAASIGQLYTPDYEWYHAPPPKTSYWRPWVTHLQRIATAHYCGTPEPAATLMDRVLAWFAGPWLRPDENSLTALPYQGEGRLLEYGCGSGWYAHRMQQLGWQVTGLDFNTHAALQAARQFGLPVLVGTLPHPAVMPESFDVVTMGAVLEHVPNPHEVIGAAAEALRPGGYLAISVPNLESWGFQTFGQHWWGLQLPLHLLHFTPHTLRQLLESHGLEVAEVRMTARCGWMRRTLAAARRASDLEPRARFIARLGRSRLVNSLVTHWTAQRGLGDNLLAVARRPVRAAMPRSCAA